MRKTQVTEEKPIWADDSESEDELWASTTRTGARGSTLYSPGPPGAFTDSRYPMTSHGNDPDPDPDSMFLPDASEDEQEVEVDESAIAAQITFQNDCTMWCRDASLQLALGVLAYNVEQDPNSAALYGQAFAGLTRRLNNPKQGTLSEAQKERYLLPFQMSYGLGGTARRGRRKFTAAQKSMIDDNYHIIESASRGPEFAIPERFEVQQLESTVKYLCGTDGMTEDEVSDVKRLKYLCDQWEDKSRAVPGTLEQLRWELMEEGGQRLRDSAWSRMTPAIQNDWRQPGDPPQHPADSTRYPRTIYGTKTGEMPYAQM